MVVATETDDVREAVRLVVEDEYVNGVDADVRNHRRTWEDCLRMRQPAPVIRRDDTWDQYVYFFYVGEGMTAASGFRYTAGRWKPHGVSSAASSKVKAVLRGIRDAGDLPVAEKWNAAVITCERATGTGNLHVFYGLDAEAWHMTPANQARIAEQGLALFDDHHQS